MSSWRRRASAAGWGPSTVEGLGFQDVAAQVHVSSRRRRASAPVEAPAIVEGQGVAAEVLWVVKSTDTVHGVPGLDHVAEELASLYGQVGQADALPTAAQQHATAHSRDELQAGLQTWSALKTSELPDLNRQLQGAHLPALDPETRPETMPESGDED